MCLSQLKVEITAGRAAALSSVHIHFARLGKSFLLEGRESTVESTLILLTEHTLAVATCETHC